jgi:hypothetical protein
MSYFSRFGVFAVLMMVFCQSSQADNSGIPPWNQTTEASMAIAAERIDTVGIATFVVPAPEIGVLEEKVVIVTNISFSEASKRARDLVAFQWHTQVEWKGIDHEKSCGLWGAGGKACPSGCSCGSGNHCLKKGFEVD